MLRSKRTVCGWPVGSGLGWDRIRGKVGGSPLLRAIVYPQPHLPRCDSFGGPGQVDLRHGMEGAPTHSTGAAGLLQLKKFCATSLVSFVWLVSGRLLRAIVGLYGMRLLLRRTASGWQDRRVAFIQGGAPRTASWADGLRTRPSDLSSTRTILLRLAARQTPRVPARGIGGRS